MGLVALASVGPGSPIPHRGAGWATLTAKIFGVPWAFQCARWASMTSVLTSLVACETTR